MEMLQLRESGIFDILERIKSFRFVVIGGYAVNAYTLPRFSADCDIVIENPEEADSVGRKLEKYGYIKGADSKINTPYLGAFVRYEREIKPNFKASIDILIRDVLDRQTNASFNAGWIFENSGLRMLAGKTITRQLGLRIIDSRALIVMKIISCRNTDIRDVFMLMSMPEDNRWIIDEVSKRCDFKDRFIKIRDTVMSPKFRDNLQGVYGHIDSVVFEKHKRSVLGLEKGIDAGY